MLCLVKDVSLKIPFEIFSSHLVVKVNVSP